MIGLGSIIAGVKTLASNVAVKVVADRICDMLKPEPPPEPPPDNFGAGFACALVCVGVVATVGFGCYAIGRHRRTVNPMLPIPTAI